MENWKIVGINNFQDTSTFVTRWQFWRDLKRNHFNSRDTQSLLCQNLYFYAFQRFIFSLVIFKSLQTSIYISQTIRFFNILISHKFPTLSGISHLSPRIVKIYSISPTFILSSVFSLYHVKCCTGRKKIILDHFTMHCNNFLLIRSHSNVNK